MDKELERRGISFVRYADDIALFVSSERSAQCIFDSITAWLRKHLALSINEDKSGIGPGVQSQLLGFRIYPSGDVSIARNSLQRVKQRVRELWQARQSLSSVGLITQWQH